MSERYEYISKAARGSNDTKESEEFAASSEGQAALTSSFASSLASGDARRTAAPKWTSAPEDDDDMRRDRARFFGDDKVLQRELTPEIQFRCLEHNIENRTPLANRALTLVRSLA